MKYAQKDSDRIAATPNTQAICPSCGAEVLAKCGERRVWHWSHKGRRTCDNWWETETEWHRHWKDVFPPECQEVIHRDKIGEKHIADVKTDNGLVIEFQHSYIKPEERRAREAFYGDMAWVVDGARRKRDRQRFERHVWNLTEINAGRVFSCNDVMELLPNDWVDCPVPVLFDFGEQAMFPKPQRSAARFPMPKEGQEHCLWCLLPGTGEARVLIQYPRDALLTVAAEDEVLLNWRTFLADVEKHMDRISQAIIENPQRSKIPMYMAGRRWKVWQ